MHKKFQWRRYLVALFAGIFAVAGLVVAVDAPAKAVTGDASTIDYALSLNGTSDYLEATEGTQYVSRAIYSVEAWANPTQLTCANLSECTVVSHDGDWWIGIRNGTFQFIVYYTNSGSNSSYVDTGVSAVANSWQHLSLVRNDTSVTFYVNGAPVKTYTAGAGRSTYSGFPLKVGGHYGRYFKGQIDEIKIWSTVRSSASIESDMHTYQSSASTTAGLLAYFDFNEGGTNSTINNRVGVGANLVFVNSSPVISYVDVKTPSKVNGKNVVAFTRSYLVPGGGWTVPAGVTRADALAIGGGGGGASRHGGGGGAGEVGSYSGLPLSPNTILKIQVGLGGAGYDSPSNNTYSSGQNGQSTKLGGDTFLGGGGGQGGYGSVGTGGSGGGTAGSGNPGGLAINGTGSNSAPTLTRYASAGAAGNYGSGYFGGGGGGATGSGTAATSSAAGAGGQGFSSSITGLAKCYAAGGGGGGTTSAVGAAGTCANGATTTATPGTFNSAALNATSNSGSGGGAGGLNGTDDQPSGAGGSGIVVIAYALSLDDTAWDFSNSSDNKYVATSKQLIPSKASFTFEGWVKADSLSATAWNCIFRQQATLSNYLAFEVGIYQKRIQVIDSIQSSGPNTFNTHSASDSRTLLTTGQWYHIAVTSQFTVSGSSSINDLKVFLDGAEVYSGSKTITTTSLENLGSAGLSFGGLYSATDRGWDGQLDQFKVWNGALTQAEIQKSMHRYDDTGVVSTSGASLRALYDFNSTTTSSLVDQTGNGYDFAPTAGAATPVVRNVRDTAVTGSTTSYTFTRSYLNAWGGWIPEVASSAANVLVVGGGGGGAENVGAGGSGGGISYSTGKSISPAAALPITVGQGGAGGSYYLNNASDSSTATLLRDGSNGQDSKVSFSTTMVGTGGIGGQTYWLDNKCVGTGNNNVNTTGLAGTGGSTNAAGGTGGKGASGSGNGFAGSSGYSTSMRGASETFAGGGGGGSFGGAGALGGSGGTGGGGAGAAAGGSAGLAATANSGGGGGGGSLNCGAGANGAAGLVVLAVTTANNLTVTYDAQNGSAVSTGSVATGASISSAPTQPTRAGYAFAGWFVAASGGSAISFPYAHGQTSSFTLYAQWTANTLNVTWNSNSGSTVSDTTTTTGVSIASAPASPTRAGYTFAGWYEQSGLTSQAVFPNYVHGRTADFTLYAKWTANPTRTITYSLAGGSSTLPTQSAVQEGLSFSVAGTPVKFGYTFTGWFDGTNSYLGGTTYIVGSSNITLTATWSADILNVTWNSNGGSAVSGTTTVTGGTISSAPTAPTKLGYNFAGWFEESGLSTEAIFPNYIHGRGTSFTLYAKWTAATYTITYKAGTSGTGSDLTQAFVYGNSISIKDATAPLTRAGYSISGWAATDGGLQTKALSASYSSAADLTLYPVWSANTITVTYDVQGGSSASNGSFTTGSTLTLPAAPVRSGYTFQGWFTAATGGTKVGNASETVSPANTSDVTLYAQWVAVNYTVTYDANTASSGAVPTNTTNYNIGNSYAVAGNSGSLVKTGYAFGGWTTNSNGTGTVYNSGEAYTFADASVTFYAKWLANTYTITYNSNGATSGSPTNATQTYTSGNAGVTLTTVGSLVKTGYNFGGWSTVAGGAALSGAYTTSADVTLYAVWNIKTVSITYAKGIASAATFTDFPASPQTATYAVRASLASNVDVLVTVASATYRFVGWSDGSSIYSAGSTYLLGDTDVTMTAQWVRVLQVRYTLNGGTGVLPGDDECATGIGGGVFLCDANQVITASEAPNRTGYEFAGWKDQNNVAIAAGTTFTVTSSKYLLYAQWTPVNYAITYAANGGATAPTETAKNIGDIFTVANGITRTGYSFNGWSDGSRNYGAGASYQVGSSPVTLTAQWVADVYTITYDWNGGTGTATANGSYTVGTSGLTLPSVGDHVKDGYSFAGWSETRNGTALTGAYQPTQSRTLYAVWGSGSYTVTYDANGGTAAAASASVVNGGSTLLPSATRANYVFEGWYSAQTGGSSRGVAAGVFTPTGSTTLYARWTQLSLYGINPVHLTRVGTLTASGINSSYSGSNAGSSVQVTVPANTLPTGTTVNLDLVSDFTRAGNLLNDPANFIVSLVVSWVASDGTVPNTYSGKAVSVTIQNSSIKAGSSVYSILGSHVTLLGTAILDGTVTVSLTQDPEIVIAATKPTAPQTVTAVAGQTGTANVSWSAPSSNGGATITGYTVTASTGQTCTTVTTSCAVTGLTSGATYTFTVTATNSVGTSATSAASSALSLNSAPISSPNSGSPNIGGPVVKAPITSNDRGQQIFEVSQKKVATTGGSVLKIDTKNMEDISNVTVNGKKAKILGIVDGEIKLQIPSGTKGDAKVVFSSPTGILTMEQVISFVAPKQVDVVASAAMPQGVWTIATPAVQALRKTLLANPDTVLINCVGYQSYAYNTPFDAVVAKQRAKNACAYLASQAPGVTIKTSVVRTKLTGPQSRKIKVTFSAVR